jgi:putative ABC transport system ATP-binding protein
VVVATHDDRITQLADKVVELAPHRRPDQIEPRDVTLEPQQMLFRQGDASDLVYLVLSGEMEIFRERDDGSEERLTVIRPGGYFGELGPMLNLPRSASARALTSANLTGCSVQQFRARQTAQKAAREPDEGRVPQ